jgi:hypothetical protein
VYIGLQCLEYGHQIEYDKERTYSLRCLLVKLFANNSVPIHRFRHVQYVTRYPNLFWFSDSKCVVSEVVVASPVLCSVGLGF